MKCDGCGKPAKYSIMLASGPRGDDQPIERLYIPNQSVREIGEQFERWFCHGCMRALEDNFRATLLYLQTENGLLSVRPKSP